MLFPQGKRVNGSVVMGNLLGEPGDSLKIHVHGSHAGNWKDWATDEHGDLIDLWAHARGKALPEVLPEIKAFLGISDLAPVAERTYTKCPARPEVRPLDPKGAAVRWLMSERRLDATTIQKFRIDGAPEKRAIVFTTYSPAGEVVNRSYRTLEGEKKVWQEKGAAPSLYGWHALSPNAYKERKVIICEGQIDAMTWTQWGFNALSVPNGSGTTWIEYEWENLSAFSTIFLSLDTDTAGLETLKKVIRRLGPGRCLIVETPEKDANDCLRAGYGADDALKWIAAAKAPQIQKLVTADQLEKRLEIALTPSPKPFTLPFFEFPTVDEGFYFRPAEVTVWTGETSAGKSTFLNYVMLFAISNALSVYVASFEAKIERTIIKMLRTMLGTDPTIEQARKLVTTFGPRIALCDVVGYISSDLLFEQMQFCFQRFGTQHFFIDSLMRIEGLEEEYDKQGKFLNELQEFAKRTDTHIHLVAHTKKMKEGDRPGKQDVKGSSLIANNADNIVSIRRNKAKDDAIESGKSTAGMHDTEIAIVKQRETGWQGCFRLKFDRATGAFQKL